MHQTLIPRSHERLTVVRRGLAAHPVLAFVVLAFGIAYGLGLPWLIAVSTWAGRHELVSTYMGRLFVVGGPALAALAVAAASTGQAGVRELLARFRPALRLWVWIPLLPLLSLGISLAAHLAAGAPTAVLAGALRHGWPRLLQAYALQALVIGALEEMGWRGWLLPQMLRRYSPLVATSLTGAIWGCWHLPVLLAGPGTAALFLIVVLALSILLTAIWQSVDGNLAVLALAHGSFNAPVMFLEGAVGPALAPAAWRWTVAFYAFAAVLVLALTWKRWLEPAPAPWIAVAPTQRSPGT